MTIEERVAILEHDVTVLRSELRGWAEVALTAKSHADSAREMMNLIYHEVRMIKGTQEQHTTTLHEHTGTLAHLSAVVDEHTGTLAHLSAVVDEHTGTLAHLSAVVDDHTATLNQHTGLLHEILERLPPRPA
ncbi:MAG: hypothetical protein ACHP9Z_03345 [Streptosporangiales bacterium]